MADNTKTDSADGLLELLQRQCAAELALLHSQQHEVKSFNKSLVERAYNARQLEIQLQKDKEEAITTQALRMETLTARETRMVEIEEASRLSQVSVKAGPCNLAPGSLSIATLGATCRLTSFSRWQSVRPYSIPTRKESSSRSQCSLPSSRSLRPSTSCWCMPVPS